MTISGINLNNVKINNRTNILRILNSRGAMSRKDIAQALGLTPAAITQITTEMLGAGILLERGEVSEEGRAGRRKVLIGINYDYGRVLTISIEVRDTVITVTNLRGNVLGARKIPTESHTAPENFLASVAGEAGLLLWDLHLDKKKLIGAGVSVPGFVKHGVSVHAYSIWKKPVDVEGILSDRLGLPVMVDNNVRAFAKAELVYGIGREQENILFLKWGPGVGSAIVIENQIYDNRNGKPSELGHMVVDKGGAPCHCGKRGCLETVVSADALCACIRERCTASSMPVLWQAVERDPEHLLTAEEMVNWAQLPDAAMRECLTERIRVLAETVSNAVTLLAPDCLAYFGDLFGIAWMRQRFEEIFRRLNPELPGDFLLYSDLQDRIRYIGPLALVFVRLIREGTELKKQS